MSSPAASPRGRLTGVSEEFTRTKAVDQHDRAAAASRCSADGSLAMHELGDVPWRQLARLQDLENAFAGSIFVP